MSWLLGVDVGGTFTDFVAYDSESRDVRVWKSLSVKGDPVAGILRGLESFGERGVLDHIRLGTTVATNALLERTVAPVAYVTTAGFRDVPFIQRGNRRYHYNLHWVKPKPLVKRRHAYELAERVDHKGNVLTPLDEAEVRALAAKIVAEGEVQAVAVALLFSYVNPAHERRVKEIFAEVAPDLPVSISYDVLPRWKEYERASTTLADAALKPVESRQMRAVKDRLVAGGIPARVSAIRSNGGEMTLDAAAEAPVQLALSGPTGGVVAAKHIARLIDADHLVTLDMGGTSTDCSTVIGKAESFTTDFEIEWGVPIQVPMIDIRTIGAGGGSIGWVDNGGMLRVGPQSAGSSPGPACYGLGGLEATVTDANLVLGRISPDNFLGGKMKLDAAAAQAAIERLAAKVAMTPTDCARAIVRLADASMEGALRSVLIERGLDPRDFTLLAFGGAGPLHASELMDAMGIPRAVIPRFPGQLSAYGFTLTDARVDRQRTLHLTSRHFDAARAASVLEMVADEAADDLRNQGYDTAIELQRSLEMRYFGQNYELELPVAADVFAPEAIGRLWEQFHAAHEARFGFSIPGEVIELVNINVTAVARTPHPEFRSLAPAGGEAEPSSHREVVFAGGKCLAPVYDRDRLGQGATVAGPCLIEESASVTVVEAAHRAHIDAHGNIHITRKDGGLS